MSRWKIAIDTGGTFTDCLALDPDRQRHRLKVLSSGHLRSRIVARIDGRTIELADDWGTPENLFRAATARIGDRRHVISGWCPKSRELVVEGKLDDGDYPFVEIGTGEEVPVFATRILTSTPLGKRFPPIELRLATTRATNALLENKTAPTALVTTSGFGDLLEIGDQRRPDLFALRHTKPPPLHSDVVEIKGRLDANGEELESLDLEALERAAASFKSHDVQSVAIAFVNSFANPNHEQQAAEIFRSGGFEHVSCSSELAREIRLVPRARTAVTDASLAPIMRGFVGAVSDALANQSIFMMTSAGGLESAETFRPKDSLLSGPAGGVAGAASVARAAGFHRFVAFDMGGTSTDVTRFDGDFIYQFAQKVGAATLLAPSLKIETVAAGGGSICSLKQSCLRVGPESAGADPGPACYGKGGPLTLTDVNFLLNRLDPKAVSIPLDRRAAEVRLEELQQRMKEEGLAVPDQPELLHGLLDIAIERMADAIRKISLREGYEPGRYALVAFGGAGPQHACAVAERLGITQIIVPADAGLLSAAGLESASIERFASKQFLAPLSTLDDRQIEELRLEARTNLEQEDRNLEVTIRRQIAEVRLEGQDTPITMDFDRMEDIEPSFRARYRDIFGYEAPADRELELVSIRVVASSIADLPSDEAFDKDVAALKGPQLMQDAFSTLWLAEGWTCRKGSRDTLMLEHCRDRSDSRIATSRAVESELFRYRFSAIVEEMGALLQRTAISTNVKERADFSCALLDSEGTLVVNAPHIPVHLGALGLCVREVIKRCPLGPGDMAVTNHPAFGGSHLPDITVVSAAFDENGEPLAYVANRAHHAEIGGITPGSMPAHAKSLLDEGAVITPSYLFRNGGEQFDEIERILRSGDHPTRNPRDNLADLRAQAAANLRAVREIEKLPSEKVRLYLENILAHSAAEFAKTLSVFHHVEAIERLDDGTAIGAALSVRNGRLVVDFSNTVLPVHHGNLNATPAIVRSALLYVLRLLTRIDIPLNEGLLRHVDLVLPPCFLNPAFPDDPSLCPAVVGGNVETSQRIVDTLVKALGLQACSQGTMNNLLFGTSDFGYYETIAGGAGAGEGYDGADALHTHMTNTAITDVEVLESRYPVRVREFSIRRGSGGAGRWRGGNGICREFEFLAPLTVSLLSQHRTEEPYGLQGGEAGASGRQTLRCADGKGIALDGIANIEVKAGDVLRIETPGGGGFGKAS